MKHFWHSIFIVLVSLCASVVVNREWQYYMIRAAKEFQFYFSCVTLEPKFNSSMVEDSFTVTLNVLCTAVIIWSSNLVAHKSKLVICYLFVWNCKIIKVYTEMVPSAREPKCSQLQQLHFSSNRRIEICFGSHSHLNFDLCLCGAIHLKHISVCACYLWWGSLFTVATRNELKLMLKVQLGVIGKPG